MLENGIETGIHYKPVHKMSYFQNGIKLPITEKIGDEIVTIPTHPNLSKTNIDKIVNTINKLHKKYGI
jgi:dTDP-4-amino-4,6-dideoxygalactose transaminase